MTSYQVDVAQSWKVAELPPALRMKISYRGREKSWTASSDTHIKNVEMIGHLIYICIPRRCINPSSGVAATKCKNGKV